MGSKNLRRTTSFSGRLYFVAMKKYYRLTLCFVALISFVCVLVYHHKYSDLNVVLQMMNAISKHSATSICSKKLADLTKSMKLDWNTFEISLGLPMWTEIFPSIYTYSAVFLNNQVWVLSFSYNILPSDIEKLRCQLLYSNTSSSFVPVKVQLFQKNKASLFIFIRCTDTGNFEHIPYGIRFKQHNVILNTFLPVISQTDRVANFSMCVKPLPFNFNDVFKIIEFITYHHHIGVNHFIFYDQGMSPAIKRVLLEIAPKNHIFITLLPWNVPSSFQNASKFGTEYFVDCLVRAISRNYSTFILRGNINSYIVTKDAQNLNQLMSDKKFISDPPRFYEEKFCLEFSDDIISHSLQIPFITLLKNKMLRSESLAYPVIYNLENVSGSLSSSDFKVWLFKQFPQKSMILPKHFGVLYTYDYCNITSSDSKMDSVQDKYMWKYKNLLFRSQIFILAKQKSLFTLE